MLVCCSFVWLGHASAPKVKEQPKNTFYIAVNSKIFVQIDNAIVPMLLPAGSEITVIHRGKKDEDKERPVG